MNDRNKSLKDEVWGLSSLTPEGKVGLIELIEKYDIERWLWEDGKSGHQRGLSVKAVSSGSKRYAKSWTLPCSRDEYWRAYIEAAISAVSRALSTRSNLRREVLTMLRIISTLTEGDIPLEAGQSYEIYRSRRLSWRDGL